jgi:hypothetical protein
VIGDPIYALPPGHDQHEPWASHPEVLVRSPEPEAVLYGAIDETHYVHLVRLTRTRRPSADVRRAVERWKPLLERRAEIARNARRQWWETGWPRDDDDIVAPKVIALHRTDRGRFALDEAGIWSPTGRMCVIVGRAQDAPVAYLAGLLNSELLDLWYGLRGRTPRDVWRDYEPKPLKAVPYRRPEGDPRADEIAALVREIAANRTALLPHRPVVRDLGRIVKDPWRTGPVVVDRAALVGTLGRRATVSVRLDTALTVQGSPVGKAVRTGPHVLSFRRGGAETGTVSGDAARVDLLAELVGTDAGADATAILLPRDLAAFDATCDTLASDVEALLDEGRVTVERVERLVCALYGLDDDLTQAVVDHAIQRATLRSS